MSFLLNRFFIVIVRMFLFFKSLSVFVENMWLMIIGMIGGMLMGVVVRLYLWRNVLVFGCLIVFKRFMLLMRNLGFVFLVFIEISGCIYDGVVKFYVIFVICGVGVLLCIVNFL